MKIKIKATRKKSDDVVLPMQQYLLLDAATMGEEIEQAKSLHPHFENLYMGDTAVQLASVAPFLFSFPAESEFANWYLQHPDRHQWGIQVSCALSFKEVYQHFRKFLIVKTDEGKSLYFRFYDPRVLPDFLKTCEAHQLREFFGPLDAFLCISTDYEKQLFQFKDDKLLVSV